MRMKKIIKYSWFDLSKDGLLNYRLNNKSFPEVTFGNSPQEVEINLINHDS